MRPTPSFRLIAAAAFALGLANCSSTTTGDGGSGNDAGTDAGPMDAGPDCFCAGLTEACNAGQACCANLACTNGKCAEATAPACISLNQRCTTSTECCGSMSNGGAFPDFTACIPDGLGVGHCSMGGQGASCSATSGCVFPLSCVTGSCALQTTGTTCAGGSCAAGDACNSSGSSDPCQASGLLCYNFRSGALCEPPQVDTPENLYWSDVVYGFPSYCSHTQDHCVGLPGTSATPGCGSYTFIDPSTNNVGTFPVCTEQCQTAADCSSIIWDCVQVAGKKQCQPNFCYAQDLDQGPGNPPFNMANLMTSSLGTPVSNSPTVLFKPCGANAGPDTYCMPRFDNDWLTTVGVCTRVGAAGAGGVGAACDPDPSHTDAPGLCAPGSLCYRGTCHQWCDIINTVRAGCDTGQACIPPGGAFPSGFGAKDATGICANVCDPYQQATNNTCPESPTWTCDNPPLLCKPNLPTDKDSDQFPQPGICVGGLTKPLDVGLPCSTGIWVDPCVSGSICMTPPGGGNTKVCSQICDVVPSPFMSEPTCGDGGMTCVSVDQSLCQNLGRDGGWCKAFGTCQLIPDAG